MINVFLLPFIPKVGKQGLHYTMESRVVMHWPRSAPGDAEDGMEDGGRGGGQG